MSKQAITAITLIATAVILIFCSLGSIGFKAEIDEWLLSSPGESESLGQAILRSIFKSLNSILTTLIAAYLIFLLAVVILKIIQLSVCKSWLQTIIGALDMIIIVPSAAIFILNFSISAWIVFIASLVPFCFNLIYFFAEE